MNLKKILAGVVAGGMAVSAMSVASFAAIVGDGVNDEGTYSVDVADILPDGVDISEVYGATVYLKPGYSMEQGQGGAVAFNSKAGGWVSVAWGNEGSGKAITLDEENNSITRLDEEPFFTEDDLAEGAWAQVQLQQYWGEDIEVDKVVLLNKDGKEFGAESDDPTEEGLETALYVGNSADWVTVKSDSVNIAIGNEYTYSVSGLDIAPDKLTVIYIKDVAVENEEAEESDIDPVKVTFTSVKINGNEVAVKEGVPTGLNKSSAFDIALYNIWGDSFIDLPEENINSVEIAIKVEAGEPAPADTDPEETTAEETTANALDPDNDNAAAFNSNSENQPTGIAIAIVPAVLAAAGVVISKKRK